MPSILIGKNMTEGFVGWGGVSSQATKNMTLLKK
jgi:hypothetical protein